MNITQFILMIVSPENYIDKFSSYNPDIITIHMEAVNDISAVLKKIKNLNIKAGLAISPDTPIKHLEPYINEIDINPIIILEDNAIAVDNVFISKN